MILRVQGLMNRGDYMGITETGECCAIYASPGKLEIGSYIAGSDKRYNDQSDEYFVVFHKTVPKEQEPQNNGLNFFLPCRMCKFRVKKALRRCERCGPVRSQ